MRALQMTAAEKERIFAPVKCRSRRAPDPITNLIAHNRAQHNWRKQPLERDYASGRENSRGDQQGITRKEEADKKSGFDENDRADERRAAVVD